MNTIVKIASLALIDTRSKKVLLQLRDNDMQISMPNYWALPGGHIEEEEPSKEAAQREFFEETNYKTLNPIFLTTTSNNHNDETYIVDIYYDFYDGTQKIVCNEGQKMEFHTLDEILKMKMVPQQTKLLQDLFSMIFT